MNAIAALLLTLLEPVVQSTDYNSPNSGEGWRGPQVLTAFEMAAYLNALRNPSVALQWDGETQRRGPMSNTSTRTAGIVIHAIAPIGTRQEWYKDETHPGTPFKVMKGIREALKADPTLGTSGSDSQFYGLPSVGPLNHQHDSSWFMLSQTFRWEWMEADNGAFNPTPSLVTP